ncbi:hypothetical protein M2137_002419 [Parabacteroides sp. PFB2-10]|nr:hypothetical protein [Parabacteroides sp. PFB2-10]
MIPIHSLLFSFKNTCPLIFNFNPFTCITPYVIISLKKLFSLGLSPILCAFV